MLQRIEVLSAQGALVNLPLEDVVNGLLVDEVNGLDPVKATITSSSFAHQDGSQYQSSRREDRNITIRVTLEPEWGIETVRDLRKRLYSVMMPKTAITLKFYFTDSDPVWIEGRVESFETPLFTRDPAVDISVICFDPDFYDPTPELSTGMSTSGSTDIVYNYDGSVETGFLFTLRPDRVLNAFTIYNNNGIGQLQLDFAGDLMAGDVLQISTVPGSKFARLTRAGTVSSFLYGVSPQSDWFDLQPGENRIRVYATGAAVPFDLEYIRKYGGL